MRSRGNTPTPMLMKQIWMAAASSDGRFMDRKHLREFDSVCYHGICHSMTALIDCRINAPYARRCGDDSSSSSSRLTNTFLASARRTSYLPYTKIDAVAANDFRLLNVLTIELLLTLDVQADPACLTVRCGVAVPRSLRRG